MQGIFVLVVEVILKEHTNTLRIKNCIIVRTLCSERSEELTRSVNPLGHQRTSQDFRKRIHKIFCKYFDEGIAGKEEKYTELAKEVYELLQTINTQSK